jgi:uncharacterized protein (DUF433 family)
MTLDEAMKRIAADPSVCGGRPCIRGTRIEVSIVLDALAEGLSAEEIVDHFPSLETADVRAAAAYASEMTRENIWKVGTT